MDAINKNDLNTPNKESTMKTEPNVIAGYEKIEDFTKDGYKALIEATKNSNTLPQERDWDFYNTHESFKNLMTSEGNEILQLINNILKQQNVYGNIKNRDLDEKIELVIEANDIILERVANNLDEISGIRKNPQLPVEIQTVTAELPICGSWNRMNAAKITVESSPKPNQLITQSPNAIRLLTGKNIQRPQKYFKDRIDNSKSPWEPRIKEKPNNLKPLAVYLEYTDDGTEEIFCHPYEFELERFEPSPKQLTKVIPDIPRTLDDTPLILIEEPEQIDGMLQDLRKYNEISVDLEHHSYRTYMGITCLMQISTGETDYLIDTLKLRDKLHVLNEVFTKPSVVKVLHGADSDILWLQRDLSLYIVNMFDTHQAAKQLGYAHLSLAYLLKRFCQIDADKHFQLADWRIRPLPEELKTYAREDTHYLLYIYHMMRNELLAQGENVLKVVITNSTQICKKRYEKPIIREDTHMELYRKCKKLFDNRQMFALKHLYGWRDELAREEDESIGYVLPNHMMLQIAELLPREMQGILACCNPIPPLVRANLLELHKIILKAREQSVIKAILTEDTRNRGNTQQTTKINIDNVLNCPHDLIKNEEFRDDLPTLLGSIIPEKIVINTNVNINNIYKSKSNINIFETPENSDDETNIDVNISNKMKQLKFLGPYERYKLVKSYMQDEEKKNVNVKETPKLDTNQDNNQIQKDKDKENENKNRNIDDINKDNAQRVAALQEHFKLMAAATNQIIPKEIPTDNIEKSIVTLGRQSEKRKREDDDDEYEDLNESTNIQQPQQKQQKKQNQQRQQNNPNQQDNKKKRNRGKKKPQNNKNNQVEVETMAQVKKQEKRNKKNKNRNVVTEEERPRQQQQQYTPPRNKNQSRKRKRNETPPQHQQQQQQPQQQQQKKPQQNKRARRSDNFLSFDYSAVNFEQFQGGAGSAHQTKNVGSNFKSRGSKNKKSQNIGRSNTRSSTFSEAGAVAGGGAGGGARGGNNRGRGRGGNRGRGGQGGRGRGNGRYY